jgi:hypothetical protein
MDAVIDIETNSVVHAPSITMLPNEEMRAVREISEQHDLAEKCLKSRVKHAVRCGQLLTQRQAKLPHGAWLPWIEKNFLFCDRTARSYMAGAAKVALIVGKSIDKIDVETDVDAALKILGRDNGSALPISSMRALLAPSVPRPAGRQGTKGNTPEAAASRKPREITAENVAAANKPADGDIAANVRAAILAVRDCRIADFTGLDAETAFAQAGEVEILLESVKDLAGELYRLRDRLLSLENEKRETKGSISGATGEGRG